MKKNTAATHYYHRFTTSPFAHDVKDALWIARSEMRSLLKKAQEVFMKFRSIDPILQVTVTVGMVIMALYTLTVVTSDVMSSGEIALVLTVEAMVLMVGMVGMVRFPAFAAPLEGRFSLGRASFQRGR